ncbi:hypothetical protein MPER_05928, partial [Moniliophthora perniciosa FA553]
LIINFMIRICPGRHLASNALLSFAIVLWAVEFEPGKDAHGNETPISILNDQATGVLSRPPKCHVFAKPRFPEAPETLKLAKEEAGCLLKNTNNSPSDAMAYFNTIYGPIETTLDPERGGPNNSSCDIAPGIVSR